MDEEVHGLPKTILTNSITLTHNGIKFQDQKFGDDGCPGFIIPGSEPLLPIASAPTDMNNTQLASEMGDAEMTVAEADPVESK